MNYRQQMLKQRIESGEVTDIKVIADELRELVKKHEAIMSVRINRQWENVLDEPMSVIYCQGGMGGFGLQLEKSVAFRNDLIEFANERGLILIGIDPEYNQPWMHRYTLKRVLY